MAAFRSVLVTRSYEQVVEQIQDGIRSGELKPGQRLPTERELGETFGVSRGVIREALKVLVSMGLVESRQGSGNYVDSDPVPSITRALTLSAKPEEETLFALFELREPLEAMATRLAAERRTPEQAERLIAAAEQSRDGAMTDDLDLFSAGDLAFHSIIYEAAANSSMTAIVTAVRELLGQTLHLVVEITGTMATAADQHRAIADAIIEGNADLAAERMAAHVRYNADALREMVDAGQPIRMGTNEETSSSRA
jgi:GntR family transcriptional repressor for pyruvate dehydrogenase complex